MSTATVVAFVAGGLGAAMAVIRLFRARRGAADWIWTAAMLALATEAVCSGLGSRAGLDGAGFKYQQWRLLAASLVPGIWLLFSLTYARGDAGELLRVRRWRSVAGIAALPAFSFFFRGSLVVPVPENQVFISRTVGLGWAGLVVYGFLLVGSVLVVMNLERTFRASVGTMRWRIKFMLMAVGMLFIVRIYTSSQALLFRGIDLRLETLNSAALILSSALAARSFFRTRNFEVDVYPSQSFLQGSITILLAGVYLVLVGILAKVAAFVGGDNEFALKAFVTLVSLLALAIFLQSDRVRLHLRRFVSRNFQRPLYDYRTVWRKFTDGTASLVEKGALSQSIGKMVADVFQSLSVGIWLWDDARQNLDLVASTFVSPGKAGALSFTPAMAGELVTGFQGSSEPLDIEESPAGWADRLREAHPAQFPNGGHRVCVPLMSQGEVIGLMTLGDRVGGVPFSIQDFDMLKCVADDAAAVLRNAHLSQKLVQAKELEAFQTMAAFFVHDLKNAASTLNLMLQNLPVHFDDPAFREDALRGVSKTVTHINRLIGRLGLLRHDHKLQVGECDLNEVVSGSIAGLEQGTGMALSKELRPLPRLMLDREQFAKVVTNLVLNAVEASPEGGGVWLDTRAEGTWAVLRVRDQGSGMSPDFLAHGLLALPDHEENRARHRHVPKQDDRGRARRTDRRCKRARQRYHIRGVSTPFADHPMNPKLLIVDDDEEIRTQMKWALAKDYDVQMAGDRASALELFAAQRPATWCSWTWASPQPATPEEGLATLAELLAADGLVKVIIISGQGEKETSMRAIGMGAYDFLGKPVDMGELKLMLKRCYHVALLEREFRELQQRIQGDDFEGMLGTHARMQSIFLSIRKVATTDASVLILGESGTGKEMAAQAIHQRSARKDGPFVAINCSAIPETLIESELFGHEKGAFTGAHVQRKGRIETSSGGTLFLDEIGEIPLPIQVKLLRFLQEQKIERVGGRQEIHVDARVIAATNVDLKKAMVDGSFREDLFYRLAVVQVLLPPLRERESDVLLLAQSFLIRFAEQNKKNGLVFGPDAGRAIRNYAWPGNVRELQNRVKRAVIMGSSKRLTAQDLELSAGMGGSQGTTLKDARESLEREMIKGALRKHSGKITAAATELGISRPTFYELMAKLGIPKPE